MTRPRFASFLIVVTLSPIALGAVLQHDHGSNQPERMGKVEFQTSCISEVQAEFNLAVATLHSFGYRNSARLFSDVLDKDPSCSMAEWGVAMSHYRQLWDPPSGEELKIGLAAAQKGLAIGPRTQRERDYLEAIQTFYRGPDSEDSRVRAHRYEIAMEALHNHYPKDNEAAIFYALSLIANAPLTDRTYANQKKATEILEPIFLQQPEHPGLAHYIIHANDHPALAQKALEAARRYAQVAPDSPHALHMPSHIFTRLGLWDDSIASNLASAASARKQDLHGDELHALDYLVYAYLQTGQVAAAFTRTQQLPVPQRGEAARYAGLYATAAIPARYAIERQQWKSAAALPMPTLDSPGDSFESNILFARSLGAARLGDAKAARSAMQPLLNLRETIAPSGDQDSVSQLDIQIKIVTAWIQWAEGERDEALREMRAAVAMEAATELPTVTPGAIAPAAEMLGDMLLLAKQPDLALKAYESALSVTPRRFRAEYGAAVSAQRAGLQSAAERHYEALLTICNHGDRDLPELMQARRFLDKDPHSR